MKKLFSIKLYLVGQLKVNQQWEVQGIFFFKKFAIRACIGWDYFIMPLTLGKEVSAESIINPDAYFPQQIKDTAQ